MALTSTPEGYRQWQKEYRRKIYRTRKVNHEDCMTPSCCYHGMTNYKRVKQREYDAPKRKKNRETPDSQLGDRE